MAELDTATLLRVLTAQVPDIARRAVEVPSVRLGAVAVAQAAGADFVQVQLDGDSTAIDVLSALGATRLPLNQRVVVLFYPPHGALVIGTTPTTTSATRRQTWAAVDNIASVGTDTTTSTWALQTPTAAGWSLASPVPGTTVLRCDLAGAWEVTLFAEWDFNRNGEYRAAGLVNYATNVHAIDATIQKAQASGIGPGYRATTANRKVISFAAGDQLALRSRQDSGSNLGAAFAASFELVA